MGLGVYKYGSGITAAKFFIGKGDNVVITDLKTKKDLLYQIDELKSFCKKEKKELPKFVLGAHNMSDIAWADLIVRNPGVPQHSEFLEEAIKLGKEIETDISLFFKESKSKNIIAVTGTRGKSTTTSLIYEILKKKYKNIWIGGNIKKSPLSFVKKIKPNDVVVLELSSWMLENFSDKNIAPHIAVVTNIYPDHLNSYKNMTDYIDAKKNIFKKQSNDDFLILNYDNKETKKWKANSKTYYFSKKVLKKELGAYIEDNILKIRRLNKINNVISLFSIKIRGAHNLENVLASVIVGKILGVSCAQIRAVLSSFNGIEDRQEIIMEKNGITYINDTTSTTPEACMAALETFGNLSDCHCEPPITIGDVAIPKSKRIILIAGGKDKGLEYTELAKKIKKYCEALVLFNGTATDKILKELKKQNFDKIIIVENMKDAVLQAEEFAKKDNIILLSPASASFGLFINEFDRGEQFKKIVKK